MKRENFGISHVNNGYVCRSLCRWCKFYGEKKTCLNRDSDFFDEQHEDGCEEYEA